MKYYLNCSAFNNNKIIKHEKKHESMTQIRGVWGPINKNDTEWIHMLNLAINDFKNFYNMFKELKDH